MADLITAILALMMTWTPFYTDSETREEREGRLRPAATYLAQAASNQGSVDTLTMVAAGLTIGKAESQYAQFVGEGRCKDGPKGMRCDEGKARTYYQQWNVACPEAWKQVPGSVEELEAASKCVVRLLNAGLKRCGKRTKDPWIGAFSGYRKTMECNWRGAPARRSTMLAFRAQLAAILAKQKSEQTAARD